MIGPHQVAQWPINGRVTWYALAGQPHIVGKAPKHTTPEDLVLEYQQGSDAHMTLVSLQDMFGQVA